MKTICFIYICGHLLLFCTTNLLRLQNSTLLHSIPKRTAFTDITPFPNSAALSRFQQIQYLKTVCHCEY